MKRIFYIYILLGLIIAQSCKKDIGNYDYTNTEIIQIDTTNVGGKYRLVKFSNLKISPKVSIPDGHSADFEWLLYAKQTNNSVVPKSKVISTSANLDVTISESVGEYVVELIVTDKVDGYKSNVTFNLTVTANMEFGMMVLYQGANGGDLDFIRTPALASSITETSHVKSLYSSTMGGPLPGEAKFIWNARLAYQIVNWITIASDNSIHRFFGNDFTFIRNQEDMFRVRDTKINPQAYVFATSSQQLLINNGKLSLAATGFYESDVKFGSPADGDYELAPYLSPKISSGFIGVAYDQKNGRFVRYLSATHRMGDFEAPTAGQPFDLRNIGKDMLYMTSGSANHTFAFFKDKTGDGRYLYAIDFNVYSDNGSLGQGAYNMTNLPEIKDAKHYQVSGFAGYAYYATNNKIYNYAYRSSNTAEVAFQIPADEQITCMRFYRPSPNSLVADKEERVLYVATWNGTIAKVYELEINETTGVIKQTPLNVFEVDGKVVDMAARAQGLG